ncbi:unnamed protein product [Camellia sinensis]
MEGRVVIRSDSFAFDGHCSVRSMKTHKQSRRSHLTSPSGRSSRTSSLHRPISGGVADRVCLSLLPTSEGSWVTVARALSIFHTWKHSREKAMFVNLEFIKAIVTAEGVMLLNPLCQEVLLFVDQLRQQLPHKSVSKSQGGGQMDAQDNEMQLSSEFQGLQCDLPFEFQVLEIALKVVCTYLDSSVADLERNAYPVLDELFINFGCKWCLDMTGWQVVCWYDWMASSVLI